MEGLSELRSVLLSLSGLRDIDLTKAEKSCTLRQYSKHDYLLKQGNPSLFSWFVIKGVFREFYTDKKGREYNKAFCFEGDFTGSYYDLNSGHPSTAAIQALTDCSILLIDYREYKNLVDNDPSWLRIDYTILHNLLMKKLEREFQLLTLSASERNELLRKRNPDLYDKIQDYHIASYLGITPISFSRLRNAQKKTGHLII
jgi:CRP-like cAMP-binding protein